MLAHILQHVRRLAPGPGYHCSIRRCSCSSPKYVFFSSSPGINFTHQNTGWGGCFFLLPFPSSDCAADSRKRQTWEAVQSNPHCGISVRRPQNILRPSSSSRRRRLLASDSSADRGVFTLGRLGTHFVFVPCQLFDLVTSNFLHLQFSTHELTKSEVDQLITYEMVTKNVSRLPFLLISLALKALISSTTSSLIMQTHAASTADPRKM